MTLRAVVNHRRATHVLDRRPVAPAVLGHPAGSFDERR
jgi:hypothetical protein